MPPDVVLHKRNGHRKPPAEKHTSMGDMLRLVHSVRDHTPQPTFGLLKFASKVRTETPTSLVEQAAHEIDGIQIALLSMLARTEALFARGELADVRRALAAFRSRTDLVAHMMAKLVASAETRGDERDLVDVNEMLERTLDSLRVGPAAGVPLTSRFEPGVHWIAGNTRQLGRALGVLIAQVCRVSAGRDHPVIVETARGEAVVRGEGFVRVRVLSESGALPGPVLETIARESSARGQLTDAVDLDLSVACQTVTEHGGVVSAENLPTGGAHIIVDLPSV